MAFKVNLSFSAERDPENAIDYYQGINPALAEKYYAEFLTFIILLETNPFLEIKYKSVRTYNLKALPYIMHFVVNEENRTMTVIGILFGKRKKTQFRNCLSDI